MKLKIIFLFMVIFIGAQDPGLALGVDNQIYETLLSHHVKNNRVDYDGFKKDEALLDQYLAVLSAVDPKALDPDHELAFYINAYNAFTIKLVLTRYPEINSIKEISSFFSSPWSKKFIPINGWTVSLDHIEHKVLRPEFKDPRIHFAINCASKSCPPLFNRPFEGDEIHTQLDLVTQTFINTPKTTFVKDNTLYLSKLFDWFETDFNNNVLGFVRRFAQEPLKSELDRAGSKIKISYLYYDWTLNRH
ncbi:MAG: DUF547 domain-containing protein [Desulfobacter sp.]|nr:DUF547 domain-containing protein [Desulfobacter sp.]